MADGDNLRTPGGQIPPQFPPPSNSGRVYTTFDPENDIVEGRSRKVTRGLWSGNVGSLTAFWTGSTNSTQKQYYYQIWNGDPSTTSNAYQFDVAYGHRLGSGSLGTNEDSPSKAVYSQWKSILLSGTQTQFKFNNVASDSIYVVNIARARLKDKLDPGNWQLNIAHLSGSEFVAGAGSNATHTGSNVTLAGNSQVIKLIDDSGDSNQTGTAAESYNIVSGTIAGGQYSPKTYYGTVYPRYGVMILNGDMLDASASFETVSGSNLNGDNAYKLYTAVSGAAVIDSTNLGFDARNEETVASTFYFCRVRNAEYNYSNNPTFTSGSEGTFTQATFVGDPKTYMTTFGLYNEDKELVAVAKLSQPIQKSFDSEALVRIKIDW